MGKPNDYLIMLTAGQFSCQIWEFLTLDIFPWSNDPIWSNSAQNLDGSTSARSSFSACDVVDVQEKTSPMDR